MGLGASIRRDFTLMAILLIPVAIAINVVGGQLAKTLQLWIFLDSIGTFLVAMLAGPWIGLVTGALSVLLLSVGDPTMAPWSVLAAAMGFLVGWLARRGMFVTWGRAALSALLVTIISVAVSVLLSYYLYGGFTTSGVSILTGAINDYSDLPLFWAIVASHTPAELVDKFLSVGIATLVVRSLSNRALLRFPNGEIFVDARKKKTRGAASTVS
ncbi:energy-coupling factor transport system substrate-specific component [Georgenia soli]|uniref:Energy-coupling factor transport system substrate-specific component n=1 Tax=Georgenia soli TaxID=638953 RepID=A0A2A9EIU0_9MICO|nr:ECF transporter S component [Georgenia soli]PFG38818.1 energy-coupling factor transport system substrate-specific component [Georgenia soli]